MLSLRFKTREDNFITDLAPQVAKANRDGPGTIKEMKPASLSLKETFTGKAKAKEETRIVLFH